MIYCFLKWARCCNGNFSGYAIKSETLLPTSARSLDELASNDGFSAAEDTTSELGSVSADDGEHGSIIILNGMPWRGMVAWRIVVF